MDAGRVVAPRIHCQCGAIGEAKLAPNISERDSAPRPGSDRAFRGDFVVGQSLGDEGNNLLLACGQRPLQRRILALRNKLRHDLLCQLRGKRVLAFDNIGQCVKEVRGRQTLQ